MKHRSNWKLFLDDLRFPENDEFCIARTVAKAQEMIMRSGMPNFISFDHDLGIDEAGELLPTGYDFVKWLVEMDMNGMIKIPSDFSFEVHSKNPVGAKNIRLYIRNYLETKHVL